MKYPNNYRCYYCGRILARDTLDVVFTARVKKIDILTQRFWVLCPKCDEKFQAMIEEGGIRFVTDYMSGNEEDLEAVAYDSMCVGCPKEKHCHEESVHCEAYYDELERLENERKA